MSKDMKKSLLYLSAALTVFTVMAACSKEQSQSAPEANTPGEEEIAPASGELVTIKFKADYPVPMETKTQISDAGIVSWKAGDEVTLYYIESGNPASTTATALADGPSVEFSATIPSGITALWAAYPAGSGNLTVGDVFTINTAATPTGVFADANFSVAHTAITDINDVSMSFKNAVGLFCIPIPAGGVISHGGESYTIGAIEISSKSGSPSFLGTVTVTDNAGELAFSEPDSPVTSTAITLDAAARSQSNVYIPSLPITASDGLVFLFTDTGGKTIPAAVTVDGKAINLERGHLKPSAAVEGIVWDWYYSPEGTGDGKSAAAPAGLAEFQKILNDTQYTYGQWRLNGATLHLADGTYRLTETLSLQGNESGTITIDGESQANTIIHGDNARQIMLWSSAMDLNISNLRFVGADSGSAAGAALNTSGASGKLTLETVTFYYNNTTGNAGGILLAVPATINNCIFNTNKGKLGGAITIPGAIADGSIIDITNTTFTKNEATSTQGGALYIAGPALVRMDHCSITSNIGTTGGGAIYLTNSPKLFVNRTFFHANQNNTTGAKHVGVAIHGGSSSAWACYNCTFHDNSAQAGSTPSVLGTNYIVANSTFVEGAKRNSYGVISNVSSLEHTSTVVNNLVTHNSGTATHVALGFNASTDIQVDCGYNLLRGIKANFTSALNDNTSFSDHGLIIKDTFGFDSFSSDYCYEWNGDVSSFTGFNKAKLSQVETLIKANTVIGNDFWNWLESDALKVNGNKATVVDMRGIARDINSMWPGSYQLNQN